MADTQLTINPDEITGVLRKHLEGFQPSVERQQVGRIVEVGDGIARIAGLPNTAVNELLEFEGGVQGLALNLDEDSTGSVVLATSSTSRKVSRRGRRARSCRCPSATPCSAGSSIRWASPSTAGA